MISGTRPWDTSGSQHNDQHHKATRPRRPAAFCHQVALLSRAAFRVSRGPAWPLLIVSRSTSENSSPYRALQRGGYHDSMRAIRRSATACSLRSRARYKATSDTASQSTPTGQSTTQHAAMTGTHFQPQRSNAFE
jgi:hypothetical protein